MAHSGKPESELPDPIVHQGHPLDPNRGRVLSEDDEKRMDDQGRPITEGLLWSKASTGAYLVLCVARQQPHCDKTFLGGCERFKGLYVAIGATIGKPKFNHSYWGACLEIPSDLGRDAIKQDYVTSWIGNTTVEALTAAGLKLTMEDPEVGELGTYVASMANDALNKLGM